MIETTKLIKKEVFKSILCKLHNNHEPHTFDYIGEYDNTYATDSLGDGYNHIYPFNTYRDLYNNILLNLSQLDLTQGDDDTFFDYNPANLEAIIYGLSILQLSNINTQDAYDMLQSRFRKYWEIRKTEELDVDDNDTIYENYQNSIDFASCKIRSINSLEVAKYLK